jgi:hypothetical protein
MDTKNPKVNNERNRELLEDTAVQIRRHAGPGRTNKKGQFLAIERVGFSQGGKWYRACVEQREPQRPWIATDRTPWRVFGRFRVGMMKRLLRSCSDTSTRTEEPPSIL